MKGILPRLRAGAVAAALCASAGAAPAHAQGVRALEWLAGCWSANLGGAVFEEQWTDARGGVMLGMSRTIRRDTVVAWEALRIYARDGTPVYAATPSGQSPAEFTAEAVSDTAVVFANPAHDFPQRIRYRRAGTDSIRAAVEGTRNGRASAFEFAFGRVPCPGSGQPPAGGAPSTGAR